MYASAHDRVFGIGLSSDMARDDLNDGDDVVDVSIISAHDFDSVIICMSRMNIAHIAHDINLKYDRN